ncbi:MAG TPA: BolA/IbaG family iron-sulfur metabolism protein [Gammaproteobacteria bacterium]
MQAEQIKQLIEDGLPGCQAIVTGDDGAHFEATVVSERFVGQSMVKQHQMVYATLGNRMEAEIHALALRTLTPDQWQNPSH